MSWRTKLERRQRNRKLSSRKARLGDCLRAGKVAEQMDERFILIRVPQLYLQSSVVAAKQESDLLAREVEITDLRVVPVGGEVGVYCDGVGGGVQADAEEAAQGWGDDHGAGPELMAGAAAEGDEEVSR